MKHYLLVLLGLVFGTNHLFGLNPSYLKVKLYAVYVSTSEYCTNPKLLFSYDNPEHKDVLGSPDFGSVDNKDGSWNGTYKCMIAKISDQIKFAPSTSSGNCTANQEYTLDICRSGSTSIDINGNTTNCASGEVAVHVYISTVSTGGDGGNSFAAPTSSNVTNGISLSSAWVVEGGKTGTFTVNGDGKVSSSADSCDMNAPTMSFN